MLLIPAIDLKDGHCVRLKQGDMDQSTTFGEDPAAMARKWVDKGARRLHLVDLNGAFAGKPKNEAAIKRILAEVGSEIDVQLGGSIIYTDIGRDGMLSGINIEATVKLAKALTIPVIASGGLSNMADIDALCEVESDGVQGVICGRSIYSGDLDFAAAQERADALNG